MSIGAEALDNAADGVAAGCLRLAYRHFDDAIEGIGGMVVASGACGLDRGDLRRSIDRNGRRGVVLDDIVRIGMRIRAVNYGLITRIASAIVQPWDLEVFPRVTLTDKERADRLERLVRSMPLGQQLVEEALR
jgi:hypothetical protein